MRATVPSLILAASLAVVGLVGFALVADARPAAADCNLEERPLRSVADARGLTFTGTLSGVRHGTGEALVFDVDDVFAGRTSDAHRLRSQECTSLWWTDDGALRVGDRYFVSTGDPDQPGVGNTIVCIDRGGGSWSLAEYDGQPAAFHPTMTLAALLALTAADALPPTSSASAEAGPDPRMPVGLVSGASLLAAAGLVRRRLPAAPAGPGPSRTVVD